MPKPVLHLIAPFHGLMSLDWSHCAFSMKAYKFSKMMQAQGYSVIEYANSPSESECRSKVPMLTRDELEAMTGKQHKTAFHGNTAILGTPWWTEFDRRLREALREHLCDQDIICHPFGQSHAGLKQEFPAHQHVETGIGYPDEPFGAFRIFESYAWMHFHQGNERHYENGLLKFNNNKPVIGRNGSDYEWVVPNYFDLDDWPVSHEPGEYVLFFGRIDPVKGMDIIKALAEKGIKIRVAGQGDISKWKHPNLEYLGPVTGKDRGPLLAGAKCLLMPSRFTEPFAGAGVEAMMCGTPLIGSSFGAFTETIIHGRTGYRCHTLADWIAAIELAPALDRHIVAEVARSRYSLETVGRQYDRAFTQINDLYGDGWYHNRPIWVG